jgi:hypothetical protein
MGHGQGSSRRDGRALSVLGIVINCERLLPGSLLDVLQRLDLQRPYPRPNLDRRQANRDGRRQGTNTGQEIAES